jgi:plasmid stability protein
VPADPIVLLSQIAIPIHTDRMADRALSARTIEWGKRQDGRPRLAHVACQTPGRSEEWTYSRPDRMDSHMKTTLNIDETVMAELRREAARQGRTMSDLVETALRNLFKSQSKPAEFAPLPTFHGGGAVVDIADREALYQAMEGR